MTEPQPPHTIELASPDEELGGERRAVRVSASWRGWLDGSMVKCKSTVAGQDSPLAGIGPRPATVAGLAALIGSGRGQVAGGLGVDPA